MPADHMPPFMYGYPGQERLTATTPDEAVQEILQRMWPEQFPDTIQVTTFDRAVISPSGLNPLDHLLEQLDELHADPEDTGSTPPTDAMTQAEQTFIATVLTEYRSWKLDPGTTESVNVRDWLNHHPSQFPSARQRSKTL